MEYFGEAGKGWGAEIVSLAAAGGGEGTAGRSRGRRMEGGGRSSPRLLTKQLCQLAVGTAWGFAIELLEGGGGCAGGREGKGWPCRSNCCSGLPVPLGPGRPGRGCAGPRPDPGRLSQGCPDAPAPAALLRVNVIGVPGIAMPACWKACPLRESVPLRLLP